MQWQPAFDAADCGLSVGGRTMRDPELLGRRPSRSSLHWHGTTAPAALLGGALVLSCVAGRWLLRDLRAPPGGVPVADTLAGALLQTGRPDSDPRAG